MTDYNDELENLLVEIEELKEELKKFQDDESELENHSAKIRVLKRQIKDINYAIKELRGSGND